MIPWAKPFLFGNERDLVLEALDSSWISGGPFVERFEAAIARRTGARSALAVCNGTAAVHLAYLALGIRPGDEIIVPAFGFMAAANIALHVGARPVFADVEPDTWCLAAADVRRRLTSRTRLIVPVHSYGNVCDMEALLAIGGEGGVPLLEDAAEAFGSLYRGQHAGTLGVAGTFSFHATKTVTTGEGGMVLTGSAEVDRLARLYRSHGMTRQGRYYWHEVPGHNFRLTNFQAALGCGQLERLDQICSARCQLHHWYRARLAGQSGLHLQHFTDAVEPVLWALAVRLEPEAFPQGRDAVIAQLRELGVETRPGFYTPAQQGIYQAEPLPVADQIAPWIISLPTYVGLGEEQVDLICRALFGLKA